MNNTQIIPGFRSDHNAVEINIKISSELRGPGFWKLNCQLLQDPMYIQEIEKCIAECVIDNPGTDHSLLWETLKCRIRGTSVRYSAKIKRQNNKLIKDLENKLRKLQQDLPNKNGTEADVCVEDIKKIQCDIEDFCIYGTACPQEGYSQVVGTYPL